MPRPALEWACAAVGALLLVGTLGVVAVQAVTHDAEGAPELSVDAQPPLRQGGRYLVRFTLNNASNTTAAGVEVEGRLTRDGQTVEASRVVFDYVPRGSAVRGGLWFGQDPGGYVLTVQATAYRDP